MKTSFILAFVLALFSSASFSADWQKVDNWYIKNVGDKFIAAPVSATAKTAATVSSTPAFVFIEFNCPSSIDFTKVTKVELIGISSRTTLRNLQMPRLEVFIANVGGDSFSVLGEVATAMRSKDILFPANTVINAVVNDNFAGHSCGIVTSN